MRARLCRCGAIVTERCKRCAPKELRGTTKERGYGNDHKLASERYRTNHPICERCLMQFGVINANESESMHHIYPIADYPIRRMDSDNWLALCDACHAEIEGDIVEGMKIKTWSHKNYCQELQIDGW